MKNKTIYLVKYLKDQLEMFVKVQPNESVIQSEQIPEIEQIKGWANSIEIQNPTLLNSKQIQFIFNQSFAITKVLFETIKTDVTNLEAKQKKIQDLKEKNAKQADELKTKIDEIAKLNKEISGFQEQISDLEGKLQKKDKEITRLKDDLEKHNVTKRPTLYREFQSNRILQTEAIDLSDVQTEEILEFGFYKHENGEIRLPKMPKIVKSVPYYLPSQITSLERVFEDTIHFNQNLNYWDVSNVKNLYLMFNNAKEFSNGVASNEFIPLTFAGTVKFKEVVGMFQGATKFNQDLSSWDVSNVLNMSEMFAEAISFNQDLSDWWVHKVDNMEAMFFWASNFNNGGKPLLWRHGTENVRTMKNMFALATNFNQKISGWNTLNVRNMESMFNFAVNFNNCGEELYLNTQNVRTMKAMFNGAESFNQDISRWRVDNVTDYENFAAGAGFKDQLEKWPKFEKR